MRWRANVKQLGRPSQDGPALHSPRVKSEGRKKAEPRSALGFGLRISVLGLQSDSSSDLINTPLQRGVVRARDGRKPFQRFPGLRGRNGPLADIADQEAPHR